MNRPARWAADLTIVLNTALGSEHFPLDVSALALDYSRQRWPSDPILVVEGDDLPGFEGALVPIGRPRAGWGILYNHKGVAEARRRFTMAHEFGHYLMHRTAKPAGFRCDQDAVVAGRGATMEREADGFAAALLMPLDDLRRQIHPKFKPGIDALGACAARYGVSLVALALRWLEITERRALVVVSRDGFLLWSRSSQSALRTGKYHRTSGSPVAVPPRSCAGSGLYTADARNGVHHDGGVWFDEPLDEHTIRSEAYDFVLTILHLGDARTEWIGHSPDNLGVDRDGRRMR